MQIARLRDPVIPSPQTQSLGSGIILKQLTVNPFLAKLSYFFNQIK